MEGLRGFPAIEHVAAAPFNLSSAALYRLKSQMESMEDFRFKPTKEKIFHYLEEKMNNPHFTHGYIRDINDICIHEPWDLANESITESEAYFFSKLYHKYKKSESALKNRRTKAGSWKETGKGSKIKLRNGLTGTKKIFTFYRHDPGSKKVKTQWVMHEFHIKDDNPICKKGVALCHIGRKCDSKHGTSTSDEGESSQQLDSPIQILPSNHLNSCGNCTDEHIVTNPNQQLPNPSINTSIPYSQNSFHPNILTCQQRLNSIPCIENHIEQNTVPNQQPIPPNQSMFSCPWKQIQEESLSNHPQNQSLATNNVGEYNGLDNAPFSAPHLPDLVSYTGKCIEQNTITSQPPLPSNDNINFSPGNHIDQNTNTNQQPPPPIESMIPLPWKLIHDLTISNQQLPPNLSMGQLLQQQSLATKKVVESTFPEENMQHGEYSGLDKASFPAPKPPMFTPQEISNSSFSINDCDFSDSQFDDEQVNNMSNSWACQYETPRTGQTFTPGFNSSKSAGGIYAAEDSSDVNTEIFDAWLDVLLENIDQVASLQE